MTLQIARLVRVHDTAAHAAPVWTPHPTTKFLLSVAPLTWTGVRPYRVGDRMLRVLRRWEQVGAPAHMKLLRGLPTAQGHPSGDRDVTRDNADELVCGYTGDDIWSEPVNDYMAPISRITVMRPQTIELMAREVDPLTQTSLGYRVLWWGPRPEEVVSEGPDGLVGEWMGPRGPERYDLEHICDPKCEIVQRLARDSSDFDINALAPNHFAVAVAQGRGGVQSELMRVVDSIDIPIGTNPVSVQVPRMLAARDASWTVGASRDLLIVDGPSWDGDAAAASVFKWAGFDGEDGSTPDPAKARQAFLVYDADAPTLKGSYKLPIARYENGRLEVLASGLKAAAGYLSSTDIPADVAERARGVLDGYYAELDKMREQAKDACSQHKTTDTADRSAKRSRMETTIETIMLGLSRDNARALESRKIKIPAGYAMKVADMEADKVRGALEGMQETISQLLVMLAESDGKMEEMVDQMSGSKEELAAKIAEHEQALAALKEEMGKAADALRAERDSLLAEIEPVRAQELATARDIAEKLGVDKAKIADKSLAEVRRAAVVHKHGEARFGRASDDMIAGAFFGLALAGPTEPAPANPDAAPIPTPTPTLSAVPPLAGARDANPNPAPAPKTAADLIAAGIDALG